MSHIPLGMPFVSQLAGLAANAIRRHNCDIVLGYYLEPYGVAASMAAAWTGVPYILKHAGSDIDRLMLVPGLAETYKRAFCNASAVLTRPHLAARFLRMGVQESHLAMKQRFELPEVFSPQQRPMNIGQYLEKTAAWMTYLLPEFRNHGRAFDQSLPTIGIYGKVGEFKGSYDLIGALARLKKRNYEFNLVCLLSGLGLSRFMNAIIANGLTENTRFLPFVPHWKVPAFIRACTAICFLERDFPIKIHGPGIPREVISCGGCLIVSEEIVRKQRAFFDFQSGENCYIVDDPKNHQELADVLEKVIREPESACAIGRTAAVMWPPKTSETNWIEAYEELFSSVHKSRDAGSTRSASPLHSQPESASTSLILQSLLPWTFKLGKLRPECLPNPTPTQSCAPVEVAIQYCNEVLHRMRNGHGWPLLREVVLLEQFVLTTVRSAACNGAPFVSRDSIGEGPISTPRLIGRRPEKNRHTKIYNFGYDIDVLHNALAEDEPSIEEIPPCPSAVLVVPMLNFAVKLIRLSPDSHRLLELCDGVRTTEEISEHLNRGNALKELSHVTAQVSQALSHLYQNNIVGLG